MIRGFTKSNRQIAFAVVLILIWSGFLSSPALPQNPPGPFDSEVVGSPMIFDGEFIWISNAGSNTVSKLSPLNGRLLGLSLIHI